MILYPSPIRSDRFTFVQSENLLVIEASDLGRDFRLGRVYDDACDVGFTVVSAADGKRAVFGIPTKVRDIDGELLYEDWALVPESARTLRLDGRSDKIRVRIYND